MSDLATPWRRLAQYLLDVVLVLATLVIGYLIWSMVTWQSGRTPAMQILGLQVVETDSGQPLGWKRMFMRQAVIQGFLIHWLGSILLGLPFIIGALMIFRENRSTLWDDIAKTQVVTTSTVSVTAPAPATATATTGA